MTAADTVGLLSSDAMLNFEVSQFYARECRFLDEGDLASWLTLVTPDIRYTIPVRTTRYTAASDEFSTTSFIYNDTYFGLKMRVARLQTRYAWAEDPASRNRHFISNIVASANHDGTLAASSSVLLCRSRLSDVTTEVLTGERRDVLERAADGTILLAKRVVYLDQTVLGVSAITTFL